MKKVVDLFCGCGGISLGFKMAGYEIVLGLDKDEQSLVTYRNNFPETIVANEDITKITGNEIREKLNGTEIDVVAGGPPCQGFSLSGPRDFNDPRNRLFLFFMEVIDSLKPKSILLENVPGFIGLYDGKAKDILIEELGKLGYSVSWQIVNSQDYGVPQSRKRVFFVGVRNHKSSYVFPSPTHYLPDSLFGITKKFLTAEEAISDLPTLEGSIGEEVQDYLTEPLNEYQEMMRLGSEKIYNHIGTNHTEKVKKIISLVPDGGNFKDLPEKYRKTRNFNVAWTRFNSQRYWPSTSFPL